LPPGARSFAVRARLVSVHNVQISRRVETFNHLNQYVSY
jgi:hypothetical protein